MKKQPKSPSKTKSHNENQQGILSFLTSKRESPDRLLNKNVSQEKDKHSQSQQQHKNRGGSLGSLNDVSFKKEIKSEVLSESPLKTQPRQGTQQKPQDEVSGDTQSPLKTQPRQETQQESQDDLSGDIQSPLKTQPRQETQQDHGNKSFDNFQSQTKHLNVPTSGLIPESQYDELFGEESDQSDSSNDFEDPTFQPKGVKEPEYKLDLNDSGDSSDNDDSGDNDDNDETDNSVNSDNSDNTDDSDESKEISVPRMDEMECDPKSEGSDGNSPQDDSSENESVEWYMPTVELKESNTFQGCSGGCGDVDMIRVVLQISSTFYEPHSDSIQNMNPESIDTFKTRFWYKQFCKHILTEDFVKFAGTSSQTKGYGCQTNHKRLQRKFSTDRSRWETKFPYCPKKYAGNKYQNNEN